MSERKTLNAEKLRLPSRIDECIRIAEGLRGIDFDALESKRAELENERDVLGGELLRLQNDSAAQIKESELNVCLQEIKNLETRNRMHRQSQHPNEGAMRETYQIKLDAAQRTCRMITEEKMRAEERVGEISAKLDELRTKWANVAKEKFDAPKACPTCGREFERESLYAAENAFDKHKAMRQGEIAAEAGKLKAELTQAEERLDELQTEITKAKTELETVRADEPCAQITIIADLPNYADECRQLTERAERIKSEIEGIKGGSTHAQTLLKNQIAEIRTQIDALTSSLAKKSSLADIEQRIEALHQDERDLARQLGDNDRMQFLCEEFVRYKVKCIEGSVNARFKLAKFKLFDVQVNGAVVDCCEATYNGVPYAGVNHGAAVNLGLDIVSTLSEYYGVSVPLFVDNSESVTRILHTDMQVIRLQVSADDPKLRCEKINKTNKENKNELESAA